MASELFNTIDALSREKGIDPQIVISAVEDAMVIATRKSLKSQENMRAELDKDTGNIRVYAVKSVVESDEQIEDPNLQISVDEARKTDAEVQPGGEVRFLRATHEMSHPSGLGRISAQLAKQVIFQKVREAERDTVYNEYINRIGEIVTGETSGRAGRDLRCG